MVDFQSCIDSGIMPVFIIEIGDFAIIFTNSSLVGHVKTIKYLEFWFKYGLIIKYLF